MTRIPPSITKIFKRIAPAKSTPDRQRSTTTGQLASPQKAVRFADDQTVAHQQRRVSSQAESQLYGLAAGSGQDMRTTSKRRDSKAETYPQVPTIIKKELEDDSSESSSVESLKETSPKTQLSRPDQSIKGKFAEHYNSIESELDAYFSNLEKDNLYLSSETIKNNTESKNINSLSKNSQISQNFSDALSSQKIDTNSAAEKNTLDIISNEMDLYLNNLENSNLYDAHDPVSQQKPDVINEIYLRRITEKNV